jgi:hypothetical protein
LRVSARKQENTGYSTNARASLRAAFPPVDTLTIASVLPGVAGYYPVPAS